MHKKSPGGSSVLSEVVPTDGNSQHVRVPRRLSPAEGLGAHRAVCSSVTAQDYSNKGYSVLGSVSSHRLSSTRMESQLGPRLTPDPQNSDHRSHPDSRSMTWPLADTNPGPRRNHRHA